MHFSQNRYWVEKYIRCDLSGMLIYDEGIHRRIGEEERIFESEWAAEWAQKIAEGVEEPRVPFPNRSVEKTKPSEWDLVNMNIISSALISICREMGINLMKTSYSTIFNEAEDFTCGIADPEGQMIAVGDFCPAQIGGIPLLVRSMLMDVKVGALDELEEGDVVIHNDPYRGGLHTPEHTVFKPIFMEGEIVAIGVAIGHITEVGGMAPGGFAGEATEIFHEGLRTPPVKIKRRGEDVSEVWKIMLANVRTPRLNHGDIRAMISGVDLAEQRVKEVFKKYGKQKTKKTISDILDYSEARMRAEIKKIPDGKYQFQDIVEDDGIEDRPYEIHVTVFVQGDEVVIDYTGSSPQAKGPINATLGVAWSAAYNAFLHMTDPTIPKNSGCFRPIRVLAPPGTIMNVSYPGAEVSGNTETHPLIVGTIFGAMSKVVPDLTMAAEGCTHGCFVFGFYDKKNDEPVGGFDFAFVGYGGRTFADGNDATDSINGNCANTPVEVFETRFAWQVEEYSLRQNSGGAGKWRGGLSTSRTLLATDDIVISQTTNRHKSPAWGLEGGGPGLLGATLYQRAGTEEWLTIAEAFKKVSPSKYCNVSIGPGDRVRVMAPGGGGRGNPSERDRCLVVQDVLEGYISEERAARDYGFKEEWLSEFVDDGHKILETK